MANMEVSLQLHLSTVQPTNYYENRTKDAFQHCALSSILLWKTRSSAAQRLHNALCLSEVSFNSTIPRPVFYY